MDPSQFDRLARGIAGFTTRRGTFGTLAGLFGGVLLPLLPDDETDAKKQRRGKRRNQHRNRNQQHKQRDADHGTNALTVEKKKKKKK